MLLNTSSEFDDIRGNVCAFTFKFRSNLDGAAFAGSPYWQRALRGLVGEVPALRREIALRGVILAAVGEEGTCRRKAVTESNPNVLK